MLAYSIQPVSSIYFSSPYFVQEEDVKLYEIKESETYDVIQIDCSTYYIEVMVVLISNKERTRVASYMLDYLDELINPIDLDKIVLKRQSLPLSVAQLFYPKYHLDESNYGLIY